MSPARKCACSSAAFPIVFAIHEAEEVLGMRYFKPETRQGLIRILSRLGPGEHAVAAVEAASPARMLAAVSTVGVGVASATFLAAGPPRDLRPWQAAFTVFSGHAVTHAVQPVLLGGYTPGSITATLLIPSYHILSARRLRRLGLWDRTTRRRSLAAGGLATVVVLTAAHAVSR